MLHKSITIAIVFSFFCLARADADFILYEPWITEAYGVFRAWSFGVKPLDEASAELRELAENASASTQGRTFALKCLLWIDVAVDAVDYKEVIASFAKRQDVPIRAEASILMWELRAFGGELGETARLALFRRIVAGTARGRYVGQSERLWAAHELCARGYFDDEVKALFVKVYGARSAASHIEECERQREFIQGDRGLVAVQRALELPDRSQSQAFRILVLESALQLKGKDAENLLRDVRWRLGGGEPPQVLATRDAVLEIARGQSTVQGLIGKGLSSDVARLVERSRSRNQRSQ